MNFLSHASSSQGNCYTVDNLMIECGISPKTMIQKWVKIHEIRACLVSHSHRDHCKYAGDLMQRAIDTYMTQETADSLNLSGHNLHIIKPLKQFSIDAWKILPFPTEHDTPGSVGFLLQKGAYKLLFLTDSYFCRYAFKGLTEIAIEANWSESTLSPNIDPVVEQRLRKSHFNLERVLDFLGANDLSKVRAIHLLHLSDSNSDEAMFKKAVQGATGLPVYVGKK